MINIGIDVGKFKHCATVLDDSTGEVLIKPFFLTNDRKGFDLLYSKTKQFIRRKHSVGMSSLNKNDTSSLNDFDTLDMCIIYIPSMINIGGVLL